MVSRAERTILAAVISLTCFCFSLYWYKNGRPDLKGHQKAAPIAVLKDSSSSVQRKPARRVIWQSIAVGDLLYAKEAIRTPSDASAEIIFLNSQIKIELEPDSVIVLEETSGEIALNFLKGNVFVTGTGQKGLKIKSGDSVVEAGRGEINLSKTKGKGLELQVLKGSAKLKANGKSIDLQKNQIAKVSTKGLEVERDLIEVTEPRSNSKLFIDFLAKEKVTISWKKLPKGYESVSLFAGKKAGNLKKVEKIEFDENRRKLNVEFKPGLVFWQLRAVPEQGPDNKKLKILQSARMKVKVEAIKQPVFVEPQFAQKIRLKPSQPTFEFRWTDPMRMQKMSFQIWKQDKKGQVIRGSEQTASLADNRYVHTFQSGGFYSVRVTGFIKTGQEKPRPVISDVIKFRVSLSTKLEPPMLKAPLVAQRIRYTRARDSGLYLSWEPAPSARAYRIKIKKTGNDGTNKKEQKRKSVVDEQLAETVFNFKDFAPGEYVWSVASLGPGKKRSKYGEKRRFTVTDVPVLAWAGDSARGLSQYVGRTPKLSVSWEAGVQDVAAYRVLYSSQGDWGAAKVIRAKDRTMVSKPVLADGRFEVQVHALDDDGNIIAQTSRKSLVVALLPRLIAPEFDPSLESKLTANKKGDLDLFWEGVEGASEYLIRLQKKGWAKDKFKEVRTGDLRTKLKSLGPGIYDAQLFAVDRFERLSLDSDIRVIRVKNKSDIRAPTSIKKVKVKGVFRKRK